MADVRLKDVPESDRLYEIVSGRKVWLPLRSVLSSVVAHRFVGRLCDYSQDWTLGEAYVNMPYEVPVGGNTVRRPTGSYVSIDRIRARGPLADDREGNPVVPQLVIEVLGPDDLAEDTLGKVLDYLRYGVSLVWVVYPRLRILHEYSGPTVIRGYTETDTLTPHDVLPGFRLLLADVFSPGADTPFVRGEARPSDS